MLPSWIKSRKDMPRPMYFFAIETTSRRLASVSLCLASSSPASIALASVTSCSALSSATRPISLRYNRTGASRETESIASIVAIRSSSISTTSSKSFSPSETSIPMSRNTLKIRNSWSGSSSRSGKPARMSSGLRNPCSFPLTIRASAASAIGSSLRFGFPPPGGGAFLGVGASLRLALAMSHISKVLVRPEESHPPDPLQVHPDRGVPRDRAHCLDRGNEVIVDLEHFFGVLFSVPDLDSHVPEHVEDAGQLVRIELDIREAGKDVVLAEESLFLAFNNQRLHGRGLGCGRVFDVSLGHVSNL